MKKEVYLSWANSILREVNKNIDGIPDIQEGKVLCDLINIVSPNCGIFRELQGLKNVDAYTYVQNVLDHMKKNGIKVNFKIQDIIDGDIKAILDCLWQIILNYQVHNIEDNIFKRTVGIGKRNLLEWCQKHLNATFDYRNSLTNNLCADNWLVKLLEKFVSASKSEDRAVYVNDLLRSVDNKYGISCEIINGNDIVDGTVDEHALVIYIALLKRKTDGNKLTADSKIEKYTTEKPKETAISTILREPPELQEEIQTNTMSQTQPTVRETISEHIVEYMNDEKDDVIDGPASTYLKEEEKPIILKRPKDYYHQWESNIDRLSQGPVSSPNLTDISSAPEDLVLNIDDFNDSFDKSRPQSESLYKPDISEGHQVIMSENHRSISRSPTRTVDRFQNSSRREYRHSPELRNSANSSTESGRQSRSSVKYHGRRDDRSPSPEAYSHYDDLKQARKDVDDNMPKDLLGNRPCDYRVKTEFEYDDSKPKRSRSDEREYIKSDDQVSERTKALRKRASASLERESRLRRLNREKQQYNYNVTQDMIRRNLGTDSIAYRPDPANVLTPLRHIGSAERVYKDEDSTFIKQLNVQRNPPRPYQMGIGHVPRIEAWENYKTYYDEPSYDTGYGNSGFLGSLDREIDDIDLNISSLERSRRLPRFASTGRINDKLWSQEFRDISSISNPYRSDFNIYDDDKHMTFESRSRSLSPSRSRIFEIERPRTSLGICEPSYSSTFRYEDVGLSEGKYPDVPLGRFDVRTEYYNPDHNSDHELTGTEIIQRPRSVSPTPQGINLGYSGPVRRVHEEIWGTDLAEIHGLDPQRQEKWKRLINRTEMSNEDVIELKQALASAIVENDILFAKITNAKKEFSEKLLKTNEVLDDCRKHLATAQAENQELRTFLNQEKRINSALEARIKELEEQLSESVSRNNVIEEELRDTVKMLEEARRDTAEMESYISENEKLKSKISSVERDNSSMKQDLDRMQDTHERSQATMQELRKTLEEVRKERHDLYDELSRWKFRSQYGPTVDTPLTTYADHSSNIDVTRSRSTSPHQLRTFRPITGTPASSLTPAPPTYRSSSTSPSREQTSHVTERHTTTHRTTATSPPRSARATSPPRSARATSPPRSARAISPPRSARVYSPSRTTRTYSPSRGDPSSVSVPIERVARLSPISSRNRTTTSYTSTLPDRRSTSPMRPRSSSLGRTSGPLSGGDKSYTTYKPTPPSNSSNLYSSRSTSPYRYSTTSTTVPSTSYREIYPHRKTRFQSADKFSSSDYKLRSSSAAGGFTDYPDLQRFPTRLKYSDYSSSRPSNTYSAGFDEFKEPDIDDSDFETRRDFDGDEEYEYKYTKKTTTITDRKSDYSSDSPSYERLSRRDASSYRSPTRSRSQSPKFTASYDSDYRRDTDTVYDRSDSVRARSISPARFPKRGILKNARSEQNLNYTPRSPSPVRTSYNTSTRYTSPSRYAPSSSSTSRVYITPTSSSSTDVVTTTAWDSNNSVSRTVTPNTKYQIEIDGDLSVTVNGNLNVVNRDNFRRSEPPPLSEEQRSYANQLIDKYTKPSCSLRTVNL